MLRRMMRYALLLAALPALTVLAQPEEGQKHEVKYALPEGVYTMTSVQESATTTTAGEQEIKTKGERTLIWELNVPAPNDEGVKKATLTLVRVVDTETGDAPATYDSTKPPEGQDPGMAFIYGPLVGHPVQVELDGIDDTVIQVTGLSELWNGLTEKATTPAQKQALAEARIATSDKGIEQLLRRLKTMMPRRPVAVGDDWKAGLRMDLPFVGEVRSRYDCKLTAVDEADAGRLAVIACDGAYKSTSPKPAKVMGVDMTISNLQVQEKSTLRVDLASGLVRSDDANTTFTAEITAKGEDGQETAFKVAGREDSKLTIQQGKPKIAAPTTGPAAPEDGEVPEDGEAPGGDDAPEDPAAPAAPATPGDNGGAPAGGSGPAGPTGDPASPEGAAVEAPQ